MFILTDVPAPPWMGSKGNWSSSFPSMISSAARMMASPITGSIRPVFRLVRQEAFLTTAMDWMKSGSSCAPVIWKFSMALIVCTP